MSRQRILGDMDVQAFLRRCFQRGRNHAGIYARELAYGESKRELQALIDDAPAGSPLRDHAAWDIVFGHMVRALGV